MPQTRRRKTARSTNGRVPTITIEQITPDRAAELLASTAVNRTLRQRRVEQYARDMENGEWQPVGEAIVIDEKGRLTNGQHRLQAVVQSGVSVYLPIMRDVPTHYQDYMDRGLRRSFGDVLRLHYNARSTTNLAAAVRQVHQYRELGTLGSTSGHHPATSPTTSEMVRTYEREKGLADSINEMFRVRQLGKIWFAPGIITALHYIMQEIDPGETNGFFESFARGENLPRGSAILALRALGQRRPMDLTGKAQAAVIIKAFNFWRAGRSVGPGGLRWRAGGSSPEAFPRILTPQEVAQGYTEAVIEEEPDPALV